MHLLGSCSWYRGTQYGFEALNRIVCIHDTPSEGQNLRLRQSRNKDARRGENLSRYRGFRGLCLVISDLTGYAEI